MIYQVAVQLAPYHPLTGHSYGSTAHRVIAERRSLRLAIADADEAEGRATVNELGCGVVLHDNGKEPLRVEYDFATGRAKGANVI